LNTPAASPLAAGLGGVSVARRDVSELCSCRGVFVDDVSVSWGKAEVNEMRIYNSTRVQDSKVVYRGIVRALLRTRIPAVQREVVDGYVRTRACTLSMVNKTLKSLTYMYALVLCPQSLFPKFLRS
jgi:hypothetical protein